MSGLALARELDSIARQTEALLSEGWRDAPSAGWEHMGALISDAGLQAGLRYETVVLPRVRRLIHLFPVARTTRGFSALAHTIGLSNVLMWSHPEKLTRVTELTALLLRHEVDTVADLRQWLGVSGNAEALLAIHGVGRKTVDYLKKLSGLTAVPVDRHLARFASLVGCQVHTYDELANMYCAVADLLDVDVSLLDSAIWDYCRSRTGSLSTTESR